MATVSEYVAPLHIIRGKRGDGIPSAPVQFNFTFTDQVIDKLEWTVLAQIRSNTKTELVHEFVVALRDDTDDPGNIGTDILEVTLSQIPATITTDMFGTYYGDIQITKDGDEPLTVVCLQVEVKSDISR